MLIWEIKILHQASHYFLPLVPSFHKVHVLWTDILFSYDVGSYEGAEICSFVGFYILQKFEKNFKKAIIGLYWLVGERYILF